MFSSGYGIVVKVGPNHHLLLCADRRGLMGLSLYSESDKDLHVGDWVFYSGGGFSGLFTVKRLAVFA